MPSQGGKKASRPRNATALQQPFLSLDYFPSTENISPPLGKWCGIRQSRRQGPEPDHLHAVRPSPQTSRAEGLERRIGERGQASRQAGRQAGGRQALSLSRRRRQRAESAPRAVQSRRECGRGTAVGRRLSTLTCSKSYLGRAGVRAAL